MFGLGFYELLFILIIALIVFGPGKLSQIGGGLGKAIHDFRKGMGGGETGGRSRAERPEAKKDDSQQIPD